MYKAEIDLSDKICFVKTFAILSNEYSEKPKYENLITLLNKYPEGDLAGYICLKIRDFKGISIIPSDTYFRPTNLLMDKGVNAECFEEKNEVKELNNLLEEINSNNSLSKLLYHLSILKFLNDHISNSETTYIKHNNLMDKNFFISKTSVVPFDNLDLYSTENIKILSEINDFIEKYPSLLSSDMRDTINNPSVLNDILNHFESAKIDFINYLIKDIKEYFDFFDFYDSNYKNNLKPIFKTFLEFDANYFNNNILNLNQNDFHGCFSISNVIGSHGSPDFGYNDENTTVLTLNINMLIKNILKNK